MVTAEAAERRLINPAETDRLSPSRAIPIFPLAMTAVKSAIHFASAESSSARAAEPIGRELLEIIDDAPRAPGLRNQTVGEVEMFLCSHAAVALR